LKLALQRKIGLPSSETAQHIAPEIANTNTRGEILCRRLPRRPKSSLYAGKWNGYRLTDRTLTAVRA
jgi:hypothetical protein